MSPPSESVTRMVIVSLLQAQPADDRPQARATNVAQRRVIGQAAVPSRALRWVAAMNAADQRNVMAAQGRLTEATRSGSSQQTTANHAAAAPADQVGRRQPEGCPAASAQISSTASGSAACTGQ